MAASASTARCPVVSSHRCSPAASASHKEPLEGSAAAAERLIRGRASPVADAVMDVPPTDGTPEDRSSSSVPDFRAATGGGLSTLRGAGGATCRTKLCGVPSSSGEGCGSGRSVVPFSVSSQLKARSLCGCSQRISPAASSDAVRDPREVASGTAARVIMGRASAMVANDAPPMDGTVESWMLP